MIACIGETVVDVINGSHCIGGCAVNTAVAASRLGRCVSYLGEVSSDQYGVETLEYLIDNLVMFEPPLCQSALPTLTSTAIQEGESVRYSFSKGNTTAYVSDSEKLISVLNQNCNVNWIFTGSVSFAIKSSRTEIMKTLAAFPAAGRYLDLNLRSAFFSDEYKSDLLCIFPEFDIVKASDEDLRMIGISEEKALSLCRRNLIITYGAHGSAWYVKNPCNEYRCAAEHVGNVIDTVGCGDTFNGAVLSVLDSMGNGSVIPDEGQIRKMLALASKAAAVNCSRKGCNPPHADEIK